MRALRWHGPRQISVDDVPEPTPAVGQVLIEVTYCGVCGTDLHEYADGPHLLSTKPHPLTGCAAPLILGHEIAGVVVDTGAEVDHVRPGHRVVVEPCIRCGSCDACVNGDPHHCVRLAGVGLAADGGYARYVVVPSYTVFRVPDAVPDNVAALTEPFAVALRALDRAGAAACTDVVVNGFGPIGAAVAIWARYLGSRSVTILETDAARRQLAASLSVDDVLDPTSRPLATLAHAKPRPGLVIDCTGSASLLGPALRAVTPGGTVVWTGVGGSNCDFAPQAVTRGERSLVGALGHGSFERVLDAFTTDNFPAEQLSSRTYALEDAPRLFEDLLVDKSALKVLIAP